MLALNGMVNVSESLISVVTHDELKMLISSNQKVSGQVTMFFTHCYVNSAPPAYRRNLTHSVNNNQQGKPDKLFLEESILQEMPIV